MTRDEDETGRAALETDLEQLLAVDPSPEFNARLRARVTRDAMAPAAFDRWRWLMVRGAVAAVIVAVLTAVVHMSRTPTREVVPQARTVPQVPQLTTPGPSPPARSAGDDASIAAIPRATVARSTPADGKSVIPVTGVVQEATPPAVRDPFSDVQVSASELKALRQIATLMEGKRLELDERAPVAAAREDAKDLVIAPITIEPIQLAMIKGVAE